MNDNINKNKKIQTGRINYSEITIVFLWYNLPFTESTLFTKYIFRYNALCQFDFQMLNFIKVIDIRFLFGLTFSLANALRFFVQ